jgi:hypothetical protein
MKAAVIPTPAARSGMAGLMDPYEYEDILAEARDQVPDGVRRCVMIAMECSGVSADRPNAVFTSLGGAQSLTCEIRQDGHISDSDLSRVCIIFWSRFRPAATTVPHPNHIHP